MIPLGTRDDGSPIRISQSRASSVAILGGAGSGKSVLLAQIIRATLRQGAEVLVADAVTDPDLRKLAPELTHYSAEFDAALHRTIGYTLCELERRQSHPDEKNAPLLLVLHEVPTWLHGLTQGSSEDRAAAETTLARIHRVAAQGRASGVHLLTVGQLAPAAVFGGQWRSNTGTVAVLGKPMEHQLRTLFPAAEQDDVRALSSQIGRGERARGIVLDTHAAGGVDLFRTPGPAGDAEPVQAPKQARIGWKFPIDDEDGADGSWQRWTPVSTPSSDSLPVVPLDGSDAAVFDPVSPEYRPGVPLHRTRLHN
ncbi:helicase HerA domain-containing protein [Mycobacteroides abscessus]|uniref:helicase HerA domain-containing protein n=1 Tax=Mycobacteroides abscessus TaxID=36809 RepID=UPI00104A9F1D|nr:DUF87 domain-containing protein [Mycobacteroides abscessus]